MSSYVSSAKNYISSSFSYLGNKFHNQDETNEILDRYKKHDNATKRLIKDLKTLSLKAFNRLCNESKRNCELTSAHLRHTKHMLLEGSSFQDLLSIPVPCSFTLTILQPSSKIQIFAISILALWSFQMLRNHSMKREIIKLSDNIKEQKSLLARQALLGEISTFAKQTINVIDSNIEKHKIAKITTISCLALSIVTATIGSLSVMISTRYFSKKIESYYQEISKAQKESTIDCNYKLYFNKLFYMQMKASN